MLEQLDTIYRQALEELNGITVKDSLQEWERRYLGKKGSVTAALQAMKELPKEFNYRIIEIIPDRLKYGNPLEGIYWTHWQRKGE